MNESQQPGVSLVLEQVDLFRSRFQRDWQRGKHPSLEKFLEQVAEPVQQTLLKNLLLVELELRREAGESPSIDDYVRRFPGQETLVRQVFIGHTTIDRLANREHQDTSVDSIALSSAAASDTQTVSLRLPPRQLGSYLLLKELGRGAFGVVWEAEHVEQRYRAALKTLPSNLVDRFGTHAAADRLHRFRQEFRHLRDVTHRNLVGMQSLECDGPQWFLTMDLVRGTDFLSYVRPQGKLDEARLRHCLPQLVAAVAELHSRSIVHRDLKPSNVMVDHSARVVVLDFGLVMDIGGNAATQTVSMFAGTPAYAAPEQLNSEPLPASDWYAVGVMLYQALSGRMPFSNHDPVELLKRKGKEDPPEITETDAPQELIELVDRLLQRAPTRRPTAGQLVEMFEVDRIPAFNASETLVARESQLAELGSALSHVESTGQPLSVLVSGKSGEGKSVLVEHFLKPLRDDLRFVVLSGRCYDRESVPFKALDNLVDALCSHLRSLSIEEAAIVLPDDISFLVSLFPIMKRVDAVAKKVAVNPHAKVDEQQIRQRAFSALRALLKALGRSKLLILFADDLQWGDKDSADALIQVLRPPDAPRLLFLGSYRVDEQEGSPFLRQWFRHQESSGQSAEQRDIAVGRLTEEQCHELVAAELSSELGASAMRELLEESGGNPFLLTELIGFVDKSTGQVERVPLGEVIRRKLQQCSDAGLAANLLDVVCISGQALSLSEALHAAELSSDAVATATHLRNEKLLRISAGEAGGSPQVDTYHDKIRETVLAKMPADQRRSYHLALAKVIEAEKPLADELIAQIHEGQLPVESPARVFDLVYHYDQAGESSRTFAYAMLAAQQARRQLALDNVLEQTDIARRVGRSLSTKTAFHLAIERGQALMLLGRYDAAITEFATGAETADNDFDRARVELLQGETYCKQGMLDRSVEYFESGLRRLGVWVPRSMRGRSLGILKEIGRQCIHSLLPSRLNRQQMTRETALVNELLAQLSNPGFFQSTLKLLWAHLCGLNRAEQFSNSSGLAHLYDLHGMCMVMLGLNQRGSRYSRRGMAIADENNDVLQLGKSKNYAGIGHFASARYQEGLLFLDAAVESFRRAGDLWEQNLAQFHIGCCHLGMGQLDHAVHDAHLTVASAIPIGDSRVMCGCWLWARVTDGDFPFDLLQPHIPDRPDDVMSSVHATLAEALWHSRHGRTEECLALSERANDWVWQSHCINSHTILTMPMLARALRLRAADLQPIDRAECRKLRKRSHRTAKWAARITRFIPAARPWALRELSHIERDLGKTQRALKTARKSLHVAQQQQAAFEQAQSGVLAAELAVELGQPGAEAERQTAEKQLRVFTEKAAQASREAEAKIVKEFRVSPRNMYTATACQ